MQQDKRLPMNNRRLLGSRPDPGQAQARAQNSVCAETATSPTTDSERAAEPIQDTGMGCDCTDLPDMLLVALFAVK